MILIIQWKATLIFTTFFGHIYHYSKECGQSNAHSLSPYMNKYMNTNWLFSNLLIEIPFCEWTHICSGHCLCHYYSCILSFVLYTVLCMCHDRSIVHITSPTSYLVFLNSSSDDLNESLYYMLILMQHISVLRIFSSLCINIQSSKILKNDLKNEWINEEWSWRTCIVICKLP